MKTPVLMLSLLVLSADTQAPLRVLRTAPTDKAAPNAVVSVTFDRPVAGSLDRSVDPRSVLRIEPAVPGRFEWRDPITVRFTPAGLLEPGTRYTVFVSDRVAAIDGSRLESATQWTFSVDGPSPIVGAPVHPGRTAENIPLNARFQVVMNVPVDPAAFSETARVEPSTACSGPRAIRVRVASQRAINDKDTWEFQEAGGWQRDRSGDSLRRVVVLEPVSPLPYNCVADLVMGTTRWAFQTYGPFQVQNAVCGYSGEDTCPTGSAHVSFSTPVSGAEVQRRVRIEPAIKFTVRDTTSQSGEWYLEGKLKPRTTYTVVVDPAMRDAFGQTVAGVTRREFQTTGFDPYVDYPYGSMLVERGGYQTLAVSHVNVPAFTVSVAAVPESLEAEVLARGSWALNDVWGRFSESVTTRRMAVPSVADAVYRTGVKIPADESGAHTLTLVRVEPENQATEGRRPPALIQVTDLAVHVRMGKEDGAVWVTGVKDGAARRGVAVTLHDASGGIRARGTTDAQGLVRLSAPRDTATPRERWSQAEGFVEARLGNDRAITKIDGSDEHLSAWRFSVTPAWEKEERVPAAAAVFTERGIYRPGETVYAKAIVRTGPLGALKVPARADSVRWSFSDREEGTIRDTTVAVSRFGTSDNRLALPADLPLGTYHVGVALKRYGDWMTLGRAEYRVAEYRPPEFLVDVLGDTAMRATGDTIRATVEGRYLFGAPMARTPLVWFVRSQPMLPWDFSIPGVDGYYVGEQANWWEDFEPERGRGEVATSSVDTLDAQGHVTLKAALPTPANGRASRATVVAVVTDVNRQVVTGALSLTVHPAAIYVAARPMGESYFWTAGSPQQLGVLAVRPDGARQAGVPIKAYVVRREWHRVQRERDGFAEQVGEWVSDTILRADLRTDTVPVVHRFTPPTGGTYIVSYRAVDGSGREAKTSLFRWATGPDWVPWGDENQFKMDVVPDKSRYSVGDTATVLFASPFTNAEAWITVEREGIIDQRRVRVTSGATTLKLPITEAWAPNAFISILVARGRSAAPGGIGDPGRPTIRVGYAEIRVTPEVKRLAVAVSAEKSEYRPGDSVRVTLAVKDVGGRGQRTETAVWAVDEGVLALTGYRTPDPLALLYQPRSLGVRLGSNLTNVAEQIVDAEGKSIKGNGEPGGGGGGDASDILRSRFSSTAFFVGSVVTDSLGRATMSVRLPDNLTTFRLMAVSVTAGDRYGSGQSPLLVTRPLLARPALPRFLRPGDGFAAGVVVNQRLGGTPTVQVRSGVEGSTLDGDSMQTVTLAAGRGSEVRFQFKGPSTDTSIFRFTVTSGADADAVETRVPTRPDFVPRAHIVSG